jgi:hypothetical protein
MEFDDELTGNDSASGLGSPHDYASPDTIAQHQAWNPDLYRAHNPAGRMNDVTGQGSGFGDGTGKAFFGQRVRDFFDLFEPEEAGDDEHQDDEKAQEQPTQEYTAPQEQSQQPYPAEEPAFAKPPAPPMGTHQVWGYGPSEVFRTPGTRSTGTSYDVWGDG